MENSIKLYGEILERPALCVLDVEESFAWGDDLIDTQFKPAANPIFLIDLQMDEQKAYYTTNPDKFVVGAFPFYRSNDIAFHSIKADVSFSFFFEIVYFKRFCAPCHYSNGTLLLY